MHNIQFKKRAPTAVKEIIKFAQKAMGVQDVRLDPKLNEEIWKLGVKDVPRRMRVRLERKRNDDEDAKEKLYVQALPVLGITNFKVSLPFPLSVMCGYQLWHKSKRERHAHTLSVFTFHQGLETTVVEEA